ncbi:MAG: nucleotidyltransferase family protein [Pontixanthobacter sp.]
MTFAALILAGSRPGEDAAALFEGYSHKALIELQGRTLLQRVVEAVRASGAQRIAVSCAEGAVADLARSLGAEVLAPQSGPSGSVLSAFAELGTPLLVTTADHALLEAAWIKQLIEQTPADCDLSLMLAQQPEVELAMPGSRRTYLRFADGEWSGCNLFFLRTTAARAAIELWQTIEVDRKRPWRIALRLGPATIFNYLLGRLTLAEGLSRLGARIGISVLPVAASNGLAAVDVDKPQDLADIKRLLGI